MLLILLNLNPILAAVTVTHAVLFISLVVSLFFSVILTIKCINLNKEKRKRSIIKKQLAEKYFDAKKALSESRRSREMILKNIPGMAYRCVYDGLWKMNFVSNGCLDLTGYNKEDLLGDQPYFNLVMPEHRDYLLENYQQIIKTGKLKAEYEIKTSSGEVKWVLEQGQAIYDDRGKVRFIEGLIIDTTARRMREEELFYLSDHDNLTNLYNRSFFEIEAKRMDRKSGLPFSFIIGNINGLRLVNDAFGHDEGDKLIIQTSHILRDCCRKRDILARTGGDEFSILLQLTDNKTALEIVKKIKAECEKHNLKESNKDYHINISLGVGTKEFIEQDFQRIMKDAEDEMYKRKLFEHKSSHSYILSSIKATLFEKSQETQEHAERIAILMKKVGMIMELSPIEIHELEMLSTLHDIGKIGIDDRVLKKPGRLTAEEWQEMKRHPEIGYRIAMSSPEFASVAEYILCHHERWDGSGYPKGLKGEEIPLECRILAIADAYDAMTNDRPYRKAWSREEVITYIQSLSGSHFDPFAVQLFVDIEPEIIK